MSVSYYASVMIGVKLNPIDVDAFLKKRVKEVRGCSHDVDEKSKFCPQCGKPRVIHESKYDFREFIERNDLGLECRDSTDSRFFFVTLDGTLEERVEENNLFSYQVNLDGGHRPFAKINFPKDIDEVKSKLKDILEPLGLWHEGNFGIWMIGKCSY